VEVDQDMFILKLTLVTCAFYMGITLLLLVGLLAIVHLKGMVGYTLNWRSFGVLFGLIWLVSFSAAWRVVYHQFTVR
jgi:hypothetical protein